MDAPYRRRSDIKTLVKLHNNDAGRLVSSAIKHGLGTVKISLGERGPSWNRGMLQQSFSKLAPSPSVACVSSL
jgi:hypothetical protein